MSDINLTLQLAGPRAMTFFPVTPQQSIRVGDQGIRVVASIVDGDGEAVNIRAATTMTMKLLQPDDSADDIAGLLLSNGADGKVYFLSSDTVPPFDQAGEWQLQVKLVIGGVTQSTKWGSFTVEPNIDAN